MAPCIHHPFTQGPSEMIVFTPEDVLNLQALVAGRPVDGSVTGVRDLTGVGNNLTDPVFGAVGAPFLRLTAPS